MLAIVMCPATARAILERAGRPVLSLFPERIPGRTERNYIVTYRDRAQESIRESALVGMAVAQL